MKTAGAMHTVVSLPWYDTPGSAARIDAFWQVLRRELGLRLPVVPVELDRVRPLSVQWRDPCLLLSQCCGPDLDAPGLNALVPLVRPVFSDLDCTPGDYFSYIVRKQGEATGSRAAINSVTSQSGFYSLKSWLHGRSSDTPKLNVSMARVTGSHQASIDALRRGDADIAAIDAHSWSLLNRTGIDIIDRTSSAPTPPFVCHERTCTSSVDTVAALSAAIRQAGDLLAISGLIETSRKDYAHEPAG